ncbi:DegT/DnrJ/EryC1/StrS family aminotransferase [Tamlana sp. 2201CG12-4]|uniref:DegT/DnrJ/EryC1/StrS family aminotransferase n=1 Tax=Tamlana sp. 2201CG12-4 TaxID=3112582 RepID=UPI002DBAE3A5|nr:DegT/DnrJ/EryC1/StrS family aminotransferase [Tamlana sp. 2201CG12-4]MEC3906297.1 DegT/DnrJ/EryC1/StrS family aminotransferase [Tamlana sp. 2201CG12-4]
MKYPLASSTWDDKELKAIQSVIDTDMYTMGEKVLEFEQSFSSFLGSNYCVMVNSGSSANLLAIAALFYTKEPKLSKGDEVIVPAVSWSTTYFPLYQYGLKLKFVDIDLNTLNYNVKDLEAAVTSNTKMILAVNLLGNPNDFDAINKIIEGKNILVLEDNCESMGAEYKGKQAGTFGVMGTFSTFFSHHMATMEGGFISTNDRELYHILLSLRSHGWTRHLPKENEVSNKSEDWFTESFRFVLPGYNLRPVEMSGAIGVEQLKKLSGFLKNRRDNAVYFRSLFQDHKDFLIQKDQDNSSWFGFSLIIRPESDLKRKDVIEILQKNHIDSRPIVTGDFTKNEVLRYFDYEIFGDLKNAKYLDANGLFVGNHQIPLKDEIKYLFDVLSI